MGKPVRKIYLNRESSVKLIVQDDQGTVVEEVSSNYDALNETWSPAISALNVLSAKHAELPAFLSVPETRELIPLLPPETRVKAGSSVMTRMPQQAKV